MTAEERIADRRRVAAETVAREVAARLCPARLSAKREFAFVEEIADRLLAARDAALEEAARAVEGRKDQFAEYLTREQAAAAIRALKDGKE
jgi:hypothetical protein